MRVICINNPYYLQLTEGKIYEIFKWNETKLNYIIDDLGEEFVLQGNYHYFLDLDIHRQEQLNKLGI
jgi:hypothetical protein